MRTFLHMWRYDYNLRGIYETPALVEEPGAATQKAAELLDAVRAEGRTLLTEAEAKIAGVGRLIRIPNTNEAEAAFLVADPMQRKGLGMEKLLARAGFTIGAATDNFAGGSNPATLMKWRCEPGYQRLSTRGAHTASSSSNSLECWVTIRLYLTDMSGKRASLLRVGGFRPLHNPFAFHFGLDWQLHGY